MGRRFFRAAIVGCLGGSLALAAACAPAPEPIACTAPTPRDGRIVVAGTGVWSAMAATVTAAEDPTEVRLAESIGSGGAIRALADNAIDIGLLSRPVRPRERKDGLHVLDAGTSGLLFMAPEGVDLVAAYAGRDIGNALRPHPLFVREPGDSGWAALRRADPKLHEAMQAAARDGRASIAWTDAEMSRLLASVPGAIGPLDASLWPAQLRSRAVDRGVRKRLFVVTRRDAPAPIRRLAEKLAREARRARP